MKGVPVGPKVEKEILDAWSGGMLQSEIASILGINRSTVGGVISRNIRGSTRTYTRRFLRTSEEVSKVIELNDEGKRITEISQTLNIPEGTIRHIIERHLAKLAELPKKEVIVVTSRQHPHKPYTPQEAIRIAMLRREGKRNKEIIQITGVPDGSIARLIREGEERLANPTPPPRIPPEPTNAPTDRLDAFISLLQDALSGYQRLKEENKRLVADVERWKVMYGKLNEDINALVNRGR